jgi:putative copper resistance protein D
VLSYADLSGRGPTDPGFGAELDYFVRELVPGRQLALEVGIAAVVATLAAGARSMRSTGLLALLAVVGLAPAALAGHASGSSSHETAVTALGLHLLGVCVWVGGLGGLIILRRGLQPPVLTAATGRFSTLAGWCFATVAFSGVISAAVRLGSFSALGTRYGAVVLAKALALTALGILGLWQRRAGLPGLAAGRQGAFARLAGVEAAVMAATLGLAAALSRSTPPVPAVPTAEVTPAQSITGYPLPPVPSAGRWITLWQPDLFWLVVAGLGLGLYGAGLVALRRRGDRWSPGRAICWTAGLAVLVYVTSGPPAAYGRVLFSAHMLGHMALTMAVPLLLVLGAPVTLALRTLPARTDGSRGAREWLLAVLGSRLVHVLTRAPVAAVIFAGTLVVFYFSPLFGLALTSHVGHELMETHFLLAGYLFAWVLIGVDPGPPRPAPALLLLMLFATMAFHAFFGVSLITGTGVLQESYFAGLHRSWGASLLADQRLGGGLAWGIGEIPTLLLAVIVAVQWSRTDEREARRHDRAADRDGDAELAAYNAMLARLAAKDAAREAGQSR